MVRYLLEEGTDVNDIGAKSQPRTALHVVVSEGGRERDGRRLHENRAKIAIFLLEHGADPNKPRAKGQMPLAMAKQAGRDEIVKIFLAHDALEVDAESQP